MPQGKPWQHPKNGYVLDQKQCRFHPHLMVIPNGTDLLILNSDKVLHNIHAYELIGRARRTLLNVAQPKFKPKVTKRIKTRRGEVARVECDAHNWMLEWIRVRCRVRIQGVQPAYRGDGGWEAFHALVMPDADTKAVNLTGDHSIRGGALAQKCYSAMKPTHDRLKHPLLRVHGTLQPISWDAAIDIVAEVSKHVIERRFE